MFDNVSTLNVRDFYAAYAMQGMLANSQCLFPKNQFPDLAELAFALADEMVKKRANDLENAANMKSY